MSTKPDPYASLMGQLLRPQAPVGTADHDHNADHAQASNAPLFSDDPLARVRAARNPLLEAAAPLLRALAELPEIRQVEHMEEVRQMLVQDIQLFQNLCDRATLRREHVVTVRYCLCTALDESINRQPWAREGGWASASLLLLFHNETSGGEKFFLLLGRMAQDPDQHLPALEVLYRILSLGFEGRYALSPDGLRQLDTIHRHLLALLTEHLPAPAAALSPHWQGAKGGRLPFLRTMPVWITASVLALALTMLHLTLSAGLKQTAQELQHNLRVLATAPQPAPSPAPLPLGQWFTPAEQKHYGLVVDEAKQTIRLQGRAAFQGADIVPASLTLLQPALDRLILLLGQSCGHIAVVGHTDDTPLRPGSRFTSNQHLSEERAKTVAALLRRGGLPTARLRVEGRGPTEPLAPNTSPQGKAQNRRVDIILLPERSAPSSFRSGTLP